MDVRISLGVLAGGSVAAVKTPLDDRRQAGLQDAAGRDGPERLKHVDVPLDNWIRGGQLPGACAGQRRH